MRQPHKYRDISREEIDELFSNYLLESWSYSKVDSFARNEKAFEMSYIYRQRGKSSASEVAGTAYHSALKHYFKQLKDGVIIDLAELQTIAYNHIDEIEPHKWKIQKTTPSI